MTSCTRRGRAAIVLLLLLPAAACAGDAPDPAAHGMRRNARLDACIAEALHGAARARLATLDELLERHRADGTAPAIVTAPHTFARVYETIADLRSHEMAYVDSAYHAATRDDSLRFERLAREFRLPAPSPESLEANVQRDYLRDFVAARADADHSCNHLVPDAGGSRR
jgi:hypothetical protein